MSENSAGPIVAVPEPGFGLSRRLAVSLSIGLHAAVLSAIGLIPEPETEVVETTTRPVVWLSRTTLPDIEAALREPPEPERALPPLPEPPAPEETAATPTEPPPPEERPASPPEPRPAVESQQQPEPIDASTAGESPPEPGSAADDSIAATDEAAAATDDEVLPDAGETVAANGDETTEDGNEISIADIPLTDVDWYAESRREIEGLLDAIEAEQDFVVVARDGTRRLASEGAGPKGTFEPGSSVSGPRLLTPNKSSSPLVQRLARLCNELTGGGLGLSFSFFGLAGIGGAVCAEDNARRDIFASVKPEYLKKLPDCREVAINTDAFVDGELPEELSAIKCRLVYKDELAGAAVLD